MKTYKLFALVFVTLVIAILLGSAMNNFTFTSDSAFADNTLPVSNGGRIGDGGNAPRVSTTRNYLPIIFLNSTTAGGVWLLSGNAGTNWTSDFLGTTDNVSLTLRVNNTVGWRLAPNGTSTPNVIGGNSANSVALTVYGATIAGGGSNVFPNVISGTANYATIGGGYQNTAGGLDSTIGGGSGNTASSYNATVSGGYFNTANNQSATVGGGTLNSANNQYATVSGGEYNTANGSDSAVGGGGHNNAGGTYATIPGGYLNEATMTYTFAAGNQAQAYHQGAFVWGDSTTYPVAGSTGPDQFVVRASGGIRLAGAGINTSTSMFMHQVVTGGGGNICSGQVYGSVISNPLTDGDSGAILVVTPNYGSNGSPYVVAGPAKDIPAVYYDSTNACGFGAGKWVIYNLNSTAMVNGSVYNVFVIKP